MSASVVDNIPIIDTDTHVVEPPDLWTSRVSSKWGDQVPHVEWDYAFKEEEAWFIGNQRLGAVGRRRWRAGTSTRRTIRAGSPIPTPRSWDATRRAALMDSYGVQAQSCTRTSRCLTPRASWAWATPPAIGLHPGLQRFPRRLPQRAAGPVHPRVGVAVLGSPGDVGGDRALRGEWAQGHRVHPGPGVFRHAGLTDRFWDPMWASAQEKGLPVNFHIASGDLDLFASATRTTDQRTSRRWACCSSWPTPAPSLNW